VEHFEHNDDNDNDSDDVEDVFVQRCRFFMIVDLGDAPLHSAAKAQPQRKIAAPGFQTQIKENKTPGGEQYLDPPGAELLAWF
jgi:hypothetical protein